MTRRVAFLDHSASLSGAELFLAGMLEHEHHLEPLVVLFEDGPLRARLERSGVRVRLAPLPNALLDAPAGGGAEQGTLASLAALPGWARDLRRILREERVEVCYTNSAKAHVLGVPLARLMRLPVLMHVHNGISPDTYGRGNRAALHAAARLSTSVVVNSQATRATLRPPDARRATLLYCPSEVPAQPPPPPSNPGLELALVGRIAPWKGQDLAIEALSLLHARGFGDVSLHVYGDALFTRDVAHRESLHELADRAGVAAAITWHGHVEDVHQAMRRHDVVIHTSLVPEPLGQVIIEAMAAGRPVAAADTGGPLELVVPDGTGLLYRMGSAESLAEAIVALRDPSLRRTLGTAAWHRAHDYSYDTVLLNWTRAITETGGR